VCPKEKFSSLERLGDIVVGAKGEAAHSSVVPSVSRDDDEWDISEGFVGADDHKQLWPSHVRHEVIGDDEIIVLHVCTELGEGNCPVLTRENIAVFGQETGDVLAHILHKP
jgi:hypothetical protein